MKKIMYIIIVLFLITLIIDSAYAQEKQKNVKATSPAKTEVAKLNTVCPVSGEEADAQITYEYKGKTYSLCCNTCLKKFKKDPEKYISRLSEDGKSLKPAKKDKN